MLLKRAPHPPSHVEYRRVKCSNRFCSTLLNDLKAIEYYKGFGYCSKSCRKDWPPVINKIQSQYHIPIEVVLYVSLRLFRSKRRVAEVLDISATTLEKIYLRFGIT